MYTNSYELLREFAVLSHQNKIKHYDAYTSINQNNRVKWQKRKGVITNLRSKLQVTSLAAISNFDTWSEPMSIVRSLKQLALHLIPVRLRCVVLLGMYLCYSTWLTTFKEIA